MTDTDKLKYTQETHKLMMRPRYFHLSDKLNREKICRFVDKYVTKLYGLRQITSWASTHKKMPIFDMITMSDIAYTVAVI